ncbi:MAG TPA: ABC transporter permease subunit [Vicinamibacterales bacterium]|nr:ABC transporter permease subunit [Vicinamibacterales bacterium]
MRAIGLVALAVFRESARDRVPMAIVGFGIVLVAASYLISQMTAGQDLKIIKDIGLAALSILGLFIAVFIGIGLVAKEVERRSIYSLLSKPVTREQLLIGKYCGLVMTLAVNMLAMCAAFYAVLFYQQLTVPSNVQASWAAPATDPRLMIAVVLIFGELMVMTAVAVFFSTFAGPVTSILLTLALWVAGHFNADLRNFQEVADSPAAIYVARVLYYVLPNLAPFNVKAEVVHGVAVSASHVGLTLVYALVYVAMLLVAAMAIFRRRDFK